MNDRVTQLHRNPACKGSLPPEAHAGAAAILQADGANPPCGDSLHLEIALTADGRVSAARWDGYACSLCCASAEALSRELAGRTVGECAALTSENISDLLDGATPSRSRRACMELPLNALKEALSSYGD